MNINNYTPLEQDRLKAISAVVGMLRRLKALAPLITDDETYTRWLSDDISGMESTLSVIETDMAAVVDRRKIDIYI